MVDVLQSIAAPTRDSIVSLKQITEDNWRTVANRKPTAAQAGNLASSPMSMLEAHYSEDAWMRAVCADGIIVCFLVVALWQPTDGYYIWRFKIDQRCQGIGFGRSLVYLAMQHVRDTYPAAKRLGVMSKAEGGP